jgi:hypothetical protein
VNNQGTEASMIEFITTDTPGYAVVVICDSCKKPIRIAALGVVFRGPDGIAVFAHKGRCHDDAERRLSTAGKGWIELRAGFEQMVCNSGMEWPGPSYCE